MPINILMPALSPTMEKGNLARWLKKEGDAIKSGDILAEIETDKATMEVEAVDEGVLAKIIVPDGTADVPVNDVIAMIAEEGEDAAAVSAPTPKAKPTGAATAMPPTPPAADAAVVAPDTKATVVQDERPGATPPSPAAAPKGANGARVFASPLARRLAKQAGLDLSDIDGSGPHGRVVERDVKAAQASGPKSKPAADASAAAGKPAPVAAPSMSDEAIKKMFVAGTFEEIPHDGMRKTIARRLQEAKSTIPHFYLTVDCELDALLALREQINAAAPRDKDGKAAYKVSVNDFTIKALALALRRIPTANVTWTDGALLKHKQSDIAVAVSIPGGLITPVVRDADSKTLSAISNEMKDFGARAKARKLKPEEYQGGVSAISNLGMYGIKHFEAVINPPQSSIIAIGAGEKRVVVKDNAPAIATVMSATISADHRAMDGALGAELIAAFKVLIENPMGMLV